MWYCRPAPPPPRGGARSHAEHSVLPGCGDTPRPPRRPRLSLRGASASLAAVTTGPRGAESCTSLITASCAQRCSHRSRQTRTAAPHVPPGGGEQGSAVRRRGAAVPLRLPLSSRRRDFTSAYSHPAPPLTAELPLPPAPLLPAAAAAGARPSPSAAAARPSASWRVRCCGAGGGCGRRWSGRRSAAGSGLLPQPLCAARTVGACGAVQGPPSRGGWRLGRAGAGAGPASLSPALGRRCRAALPAEESGGPCPAGGACRGGVSPFEGLSCRSRPAGGRRSSQRPGTVAEAGLGAVAACLTSLLKAVGRTCGGEWRSVTYRFAAEIRKVWFFFCVLGS